MSVTQAKPFPVPNLAYSPPHTPASRTHAEGRTGALDQHRRDRALNRVMTAVLKDDTQLVKMFFDDPGFRRWLADQVFKTISKVG